MIPTAFDAFYASLFLRFLRRTYRKLAPSGPGEYAVILAHENSGYIIGRYHSEGKAMVVAKKACHALHMKAFVKNPAELNRIASKISGRIMSIFDANTDINPQLHAALVMSRNANQTPETTRP